MFLLAAKEAEECSMLDRPNGPLKLGLMNICLKLKKAKEIDTFLYQHFRRAGHSWSSSKPLVQPVEKNYTQVQFYRKIQKYFKTWNWT